MTAVSPRRIWQPRVPVYAALAALFLALGAARPLWAAPPAPNVQVSDYQITLKFNLPAHQVAVVSKLTFTPLQQIATTSFQLNQNFRLDRVTDGKGQPLVAERNADRLNVTFPSPLAGSLPQTLSFEYSGSLATADLSPIAGIRTAYVGPEGAFLLYPALWFPTAGYNTDRFTATVTANLPAGYGLLASGRPTATPQSNDTVTYTYRQDRPTFPGSIVVTKLQPQTFASNGLTANVYFSDVPAELTRQYADSAGRIYNFLVSRFGTPPSNTLHFVELPNDSLPSFSSPNLIFLSRNSIGSLLNYKLLTDEIAQQWFGVSLSPATLNDAWLQYGAARFCEALYLEDVAGKAALQDLVRDFTVGALSYTETSLANVAQLDPFSPQFQDLTYDKGAMLFHMLRWMIGDQNLFAGMRQFVADNAWKPVTTAQFEDTLEKTSHSDLRGFFSEWYHGNGAPEFSNQYVIYRLSTASPATTPAGKSAAAKPAFRITGKITQNFDLFRMPVGLRVETDGATEDKRVDVAGTDSSFTIDVVGRPRKITVDPDNWILKFTPEVKLRVFVARGDNDVAASDFQAALKEYNSALQVNPISSLAHYRIAESYFLQQNWQSAANEYREALNGDLDPRWIEVWSHIQLGKIFDLTGQRDRAVNEYQLAVQTRDNTQGAQQLARQYLQQPYKASTTGIG